MSKTKCLPETTCCCDQCRPLDEDGFDPTVELCPFHSAAPDLLAALREVLEIGRAGAIERRETGKPTWNALEEVARIARAAISRAEGGAK